MKRESWGSYVLVFVSSAEQAARTEDAVVDVPCDSRIEFEVGRVTFCGELPNVAQSHPMDLASKLVAFLTSFRKLRHHGIFVKL